MTRVQPDYASYLLRLWRENGTASWRVSLESTATRERQGFANLESAFVFLQAQVGVAPRHGEEGRGGLAGKFADLRRNLVTWWRVR